MLQFKHLWHCQYCRRATESCTGSWLPLKPGEIPSWFSEAEYFCHACLQLYHYSSNTSFHPKPGRLERWFYRSVTLRSHPIPHHLLTLVLLLQSLVAPISRSSKAAWCPQDLTHGPWAPSDGRSLDLGIWPQRPQPQQSPDEHLNL